MKSFVALVISFLCLASGVYIKLAPDTERCFQESLPARGTVTVQYSAIGATQNAAGECTLTATSPKGKQVAGPVRLDHSGASAEIPVRATVDGLYTICVKNAGNTDSSWTVNFDHGNLGIFKSNDGKISRPKISRLLALVDGLSLDSDFHAREEAKFAAAGAQAGNFVTSMNALAVGLIVLVAAVSSRRLGKFVRYSRIV